MSEGGLAVTEDGFLGGRLRLRQPSQGHRAGHDAILLAAATPARSGERIVDLGAGVGAAGLAVACRVPGVDLVLVERDHDLVALARENIASNGLSARAVALDITASAAAFAEAGLAPGGFDRVLMNPPFNDAARHRASPDPSRRAAHEAGSGTLDGWVHAARRLLKPGGTLTLIWRPEGLGEVLTALTRGFGDVTVLPVHARQDARALRVLVRATQASAAPVVLLPGLVLHGPSGQTPPEMHAIFSGNEILPLARI